MLRTSKDIECGFEFSIIIPKGSKITLASKDELPTETEKDRHEYIERRGGILYRVEGYKYLKYLWPDQIEEVPD